MASHSALSDEDPPVLDGHLPSPERDCLGQQPIEGIESRDLGEGTLWAQGHATGGDVIFCAVPGAHQATFFVDRALGEIGTKVAAPSTHCEELAAGVPDGVVTCAGERRQAVVLQRCRRQRRGSW